ncbi:hypothetical protein O6H91_22G040600 [Diphasiastrum complanatum]|uniref:Uncharacterized protein n=1 Tax=Diphasiastrum complanatum TaxID=34168 RepID=A0ACC2AEU2_DIPCM|nr:hypothetical protein O6H91_22G040600 [Diphasiastrum complanatum]
MASKGANAWAAMPLSGLGSILLMATLITLGIDIYYQSRSANCQCENQSSAVLLGTNIQSLQDLPGAASGRKFTGYGCAAHVYVQFGAYRGGNRTFAILGLASKPLHSYGRPNFACFWKSAKPTVNSSGLHEGFAKWYLTDWGYGRVYTVVSINCTFDTDMGTDSDGGELILDAFTGDMFGRKERIVALTEKPGDYDASVFDPPYPYDYLYCGSPLYGDLNPQMMKEWLIHHTNLFGPRSHFVFQDAGGIHSGVWKVLEPWIRMGRVTVQNIKQQSQYDSYYFNQFLVLDDCLHRTRFMANWTFFFDLDEYIYVQPPSTLRDILDQYSDSAAHVAFRQFRLSDKLCTSKENSSAAESSKWLMEKLTYHYANSQNHDVKVVLNPRRVYATGVHGAEQSDGSRETFPISLARYYHYHNTITRKGELCQEFLDPNQSANFSVGNDLYTYDGSMIPFAEKSKQLELQLFGAASN